MLVGLISTIVVAVERASGGGGGCGVQVVRINAVINSALSGKFLRYIMINPPNQLISQTVGKVGTNGL